MTQRSEDPLDVVRASPAAVAAHDKQAWLRLFARHHVIEDPVGARPVVGGLFDRRTGDREYGPLGRFWDAFIAPNEVSFRADQDIVHGSTVVRDVFIETRTPTGVVVGTPAHLVYELTDEDGSLRIGRLAAHWEVGPVVRQLVGPSAAHLRGMALHAARLLRYQGVGGAVAFARSVRNAGGAGKAAVTDLVEAARRGDGKAARLLGGAVPTDLGTLIAAGDTVTARCTVDGAPALLLCYLNRNTARVTRCTLYVDGL